MKRKKMNSKIETGKWNLKEVFDKDKNLKIPDFQRPYAWEKEQVIQLLKDLEEAFKQKQEYLIGNLILYKNKEKSTIDIIDGQQRITTLALLFKVLGKDVEFLKEEINVLSAKRLKENYQIIKNHFENYSKKDDFLNFLKDKVFVTYVQTTDLEEAFVLFDSQNTRGKPLKRKDILKVHHIHPIKEKREIYAKKWENWEEKKDIDKLDKTLYLISFIRKTIRGELKPEYLNYLDVFKELKSKVPSYKLNNYNQPPIFEMFNFDFENNLIEFTTKPIRKQGCYLKDGINYLPFEINSSISRGEMFFAFVWKYFELFNELIENEVFKVLDEIDGKGNSYLRTIYKTTLMLYVDKFGYEELETFARKVFILLAYFRIKKGQVRADGVVKFEWSEGNKFNFYNEIMLSYSIQELLDKLDEYIEFKIDKEEFEKINEKQNTQKKFWKKGKAFFNIDIKRIKDEQ